MSVPFADTRWSLIRQAGTGTPEARAALSDLCAMYYSPVLAFITACTPTADAARDLTHGFFESLLAGQSLAGADPARGRFRSFLLGAVKHFLYNESARLRALKRGGQACHEPIDDLPDFADPAALPPDTLFDRHWACALLDHTLDRLRAEQEAAGKGAHWPVLRPWLAAQSAHGDTAAAAAELGVSETAIRVHLHRLRKRWRELLRAELRHTLPNGEDPDKELRCLLGALS